MFVRVSAVLFPNRDERKLSMTEINGVVHLLGHQSSGHDVFVTSNTSDFIDGGKRERLKSVLNVVVMSPEETVVWLCKTQGWENPEGQTKSVQPRGKRGGH